jgi:hypothetical protein
VLLLLAAAISIVLLALIMAASLRRRGRHRVPAGRLGRIRDRALLFGDWGAGGPRARQRRAWTSTSGTGGGTDAKDYGTSCGSGGCGSGGCGSGGGCGGGGGS